MPDTVRIRPEDRIDTNLSGATLMDVETQHLFNLLHHYESDCWNQPAPTEGLVFKQSFSSTEVTHRDLAAIPEIGRLVVPDQTALKDYTQRRGRYNSVSIPGLWVSYAGALLTVHGARRGFPNPATERRQGREVREARSITQIPSGPRLLEAGLGYVFPRRGELAVDPKHIDGYKIVLRLDERHPELPVARRYETTQGVERPTTRTQIREEQVVKDFLELYRKAMWGTVSEPA